MKCLSTSILCLLSFNMCHSLKLSIFYETLCPDSVHFFRKQLQPTYKKVGTALQIEFVPHGRVTAHTSKDGKQQFSCQHGPEECYGNMMHACILAQNLGQDTDFNVLMCSMKRHDPALPGAIKNCTRRFGVDFKSVKECADGEQGQKLFLQYGKRTNTAVPGLPNVPALMINDRYDLSMQKSLELNLLKTVCSYLSPKPKEC